MKTAGFRCIAFSVGALLVSALACVIYSISVSLSAEQSHQAQSVVLDVLTEYVKTHPGQWPKGWEELVNVRISGQVGIYGWPNNMSAIRERIDVDFKVKVSDVANMTLQEFPVVRLIGPNYGIIEMKVSQLIDDAKYSTLHQE